jgi:hypothetical protein
VADGLFSHHTEYRKEAEETEEEIARGTGRQHKLEKQLFPSSTSGSGAPTKNISTRQQQQQRARIQKQDSSGLPYTPAASPDMMITIPDVVESSPTKKAAEFTKLTMNGSKNPEKTKFEL